MIEIDELMFFIIAGAMLIFWLVYLPKKNKQPKIEDMIPVENKTLCKEFHSTVWIDSPTYGFSYCPVCEWFPKDWRR